ncbi:MAG: uracil-DNA glycosylase [Rubrivivax sp.]
MQPCGNRLIESIGRQIGAHRSDWAPLLRAWADSDAGRGLIRHIDSRLAAGVAIYPADVFRALTLTPLSTMRVLILGQDPYHGPGQAEGLAFSVPAGQRYPPSLRNVFKELQRDLGFEVPRSGSLLPWAGQGVLLLNTALTVEDGLPASHSTVGWEALTDKIVIAAAEHALPKVFMLWGVHAQAKAALVAATGRPHLVLQCNHPSPLSASRGPTPFFGCAHFSQACSFLGGAQPGVPTPSWKLQGGLLPASG